MKHIYFFKCLEESLKEIKSIKNLFKMFKFVYEDLSFSFNSKIKKNKDKNKRSAKNVERN